jgi:hypothetical protein
MPLLAVGVLTVALGFAALVIDVGRAYLVQRQLQSVADAVALSASDSLPDVSAAATVAGQFGPANKNRVRNVAVTQSVTPWCLSSLSYCYGNTPGRAPTNGKANGVVVTEQASVPTTFAKLFGIGSIPVRAKATACGMCAVQPLDIALVIDRTGSMSDNMNDLRNGVRSFLSALDPELDYVTLLVLPPLSGRSVCSRAPDSSAYPLDYGNSYPLGSDSTYTAVRMSHDYLRADGTLNGSSSLVGAVNCLQAAGSTSYKQALVVAQDELLNHGSGRQNVQRVIVFESDGAANTTPDSAFDRNARTSTVGGSYNRTTVYQPYSSRSADVLRPCGSAVDYSRNVIRPSGTLVYTVGYAVSSSDRCYQAPHAYVASTNWRGTQTMGEVDYQDVAEGISAPDALAQIADPGNAVTQSTAGDMTASFQKIATKLMNARLVPDSEGGG